MKYELIKTDISAEQPVMIDIVEDDIVVGQEIDPAKYKVTITIGIHPTDGIGADFSKDITVTSNNLQTGFQVDTQREQAVNEYIANINIVV